MPWTPLDLTPPQDLAASHYLKQADLREEVTELLRRARPRARARLKKLRSQPWTATMKIPRLGDFGVPSPLPQMRRDYETFEKLLETITEFDPPQLEETGQPHLLSIVQDIVRPSFLVVDDHADFEPAAQMPVETVAYWKQRIIDNAAHLQGVYQAVGRIDVKNHETKDWCGTGWLVRPDVLVTNRHVADDFQRSAGEGWTFRQSIDGRPLEAALDYANDPDAGADTHRITAILHLEPSGGPDVAFLRVERDHPRGPGGAGLPLATEAEILAAHDVLAIGYPRYDSASPEPADMVHRMFGAKFNVKRASPGTIMKTVLAENYLTHDCSTLGRSSGSAIIDLASGKSVGLHMGGKFLRANFAVSSSWLRSRLDKLDL